MVVLQRQTVVVVEIRTTAAVAVVQMAAIQRFTMAWVIRIFQQPIGRRLGI
jgi:hypothetical protein